MTIRFDSRGNLIGFFLIIAGSIVLSVLAAGKQNQFWSSPLIGIAVMFLFGDFPPNGKHSWFLWFYFCLCLGSGALLLFTPEQVYWTTPLLLGVILNLFAMPELNFETSSQEQKNDDGNI